MAEVHGTVHDRFGGVRDALAAQLDDEELGASIAVDVDGETVVDIWGGWRDEARTTPWTRDTIVNVWSTTKAVTALAVLTLVEQGRVDVHAPVAEYWPEFAANGKDGVLVRHLMAHTSGVAGWDPPFTVEEMYDWDTSVARLATQAPWWEPGTASGYHAQNQGHLLGEVVRRVDGRSLRQYVAEELAAPLGADFRIGAREEDADRIAPVVPPPPLPFDLAALDPASPMLRCFTGPVADAAKANTAPGGPPTWGRSTGTATRRASSTSCGWCRSAARPATSGCSRRRRSTWSSTSRPTASTSCWACRSGSASASGSRPRGPCRTCPGGGPASGGAGAAR
nr:serine hydrolase domain-containing protein [Geodermatophilus sp. LHW52908]